MYMIEVNVFRLFVACLCVLGWEAAVLPYSFSKQIMSIYILSPVRLMRINIEQRRKIQ